MAKLQLHVHDTVANLNVTPIDLPIGDDLAIALHLAIASADAGDTIPNDGILEETETLNSGVKVFGFKIPIHDTLTVSLSVTE